MLAVLAEKEDPTGESRVRERDRGKALAGKSTLNRLELTKAAVEKKERYKKVVIDPGAVDRLLAQVFLESYTEPPAEIVAESWEARRLYEELYGARGEMENRIKEPAAAGPQILLGLGEEGRGPIYRTGSRSLRTGPQPRAASLPDYNPQTVLHRDRRHGELFRRCSVDSHRNSAVAVAQSYFKAVDGGAYIRKRRMRHPRLSVSPLTHLRLDRTVWPCLS